MRIFRIEPVGATEAGYSRRIRQVYPGCCLQSGFRLDAIRNLGVYEDREWRTLCAFDMFAPFDLGAHLYSDVRQGPHKNGKGCGFIVIDKISNPVLSASLCVYKNGKLECEDVAGKPFYMLDAEEDRIYMMAPFIGAGYGIGWRILESRGIWFRPVYWPWRQGEVQGYREAVQKAQEAWSAKEETK